MNNGRGGFGAVGRSGVGPGLVVGAGVGPCAPTGVYDVLDPLCKLVFANNRGRTGVLEPPILQNAGVIRDAEGRFQSNPVTIFDTMTGIDCIVGEQMAVVLGSSVVDPESFLTNAAVLVQVRAVLRFGLGSAPFVAECDWLHGTALAVTTDTITVQARYIFQTDPLAAIPEDLRLPTFELAAGVGKWSASRNSNGARLTEIRHLDPGELKRIAIPPFTCSLNVQPFGSSATVLSDVRSFGAPYAARYDKSAPLTNYQGENSLPNFGGGEFVEIANPGNAAIRVAVIFGLTL